jgi:hypothetical protein
MSELKVNKISPRSGTDVTLGDSGDTFTVPAGATLSNLGTASGFGLTWQSVQTTGFTAVKGNAYPCDTTSAAFTVTLPATPSAGDQVQLVDYAGTFDTNFLTIDPNGEDIEGGTDNLQLRGEREGVILTYIDSTQGWIATSGINEGTDALEPEPYSVDFLVIAGGGGGGGTGANGYSAGAGGGGAGGYRNSYLTETSGGGGSSEASLSFNTGTVYTITVGSGGSGRTAPSLLDGVIGNDSSISGTGITTITSVGGGSGGRAMDVGTPSLAGGSGGGGGNINGSGTTGGLGTANQGFNGGNGGSPYSAAGGGGAGVAAANGIYPNGGNGGNGLASSITGSSVTRAGGGGGGSYTSGTPGTGGTGGGGNAGANNGTVNTGSGGGGSVSGGDSGSGGSGVVILRMPTAKYSATTTGSPTVTTDGTDTVIVFNASGSITG